MKYIKPKGLFVKTPLFLVQKQALRKWANIPGFLPIYPPSLRYKKQLLHIKATTTMITLIAYALLQFSILTGSPAKTTDTQSNPIQTCTTNGGNGSWVEK